MNAQRNPFAKGGLRRVAGTMNATEARYALDLRLRSAAGEVLWFAFEGITLRLADDVRYTPDFVVQLADGTLEAHEVKGHWLTAARVKIKVAASLFPFRFCAVQAVAKKDGGGWKVEEF